jgi:hypothetical protein
MSLRVLKKDIPKHVLDVVKREPLDVRLVVLAPSLQTLKTVLALKDANATVKVALTRSLVLSEAHRTGDGDIKVSGDLKIDEIELENLNTLTIERGGSYSFTGVHHTFYSWERNYNAGYSRNDTWVTYRIVVPSSGWSGSYEVLDEKTRRD